LALNSTVPHNVRLALPCVPCDESRRRTVLPRVVCVEGNIGAGKSTLLRRLAAERRACVLQEPVDEWGPLLKLLYNDPARWGFTMQVAAMQSFSRVPRVSCGRVLVVERSPRSSFFVFARDLAAQGHLTSEEVLLLRHQHDFVGWAPSRTVYIRTTPSTLSERVRVRGRPGEEMVDHALLARLHALHEQEFAACDTTTVVDGALPPADLADAVHLCLGDY